MRAEGLKELAHQLGVEGANLLRGEGHVPHKEGPPRQVQRAGHLCVIHRHPRVAIAPDAPLVAQCPRKACPSAIPQSSTVWWSSMCRSPLAVTSMFDQRMARAAGPACGRRSPTPVGHLPHPRAVQRHETAICVSVRRPFHPRLPHVRLRLCAGLIGRGSRRIKPYIRKTPTCENGPQRRTPAAPPSSR